MSQENYTTCTEYVQCFFGNFRNSLHVYGSSFGCRQLIYSIYCTVILSGKGHSQAQIVTRLIHAAYFQLPFFSDAPQISLKPDYPTEVHLVDGSSLFLADVPPLCSSTFFPPRLVRPVCLRWWRSNPFCGKWWCFIGDFCFQKVPPACCCPAKGSGRVDAGGKQWADGKRSLGWMFSACAAGWWSVARKQTACTLFYCYLLCCVLF